MLWEYPIYKTVLNSCDFGKIQNNNLWNERGFTKFNVVFEATLSRNVFLIARICYGWLSFGYKYELTNRFRYQLGLGLHKLNKHEEYFVAHLFRFALWLQNLVWLGTDIAKIVSFGKSKSWPISTKPTISSTNI